MTQTEFERRKRDLEMLGTGHSFPDFDTDDQKEAKEAAAIKKEEIRRIRFSFTEIQSFTQIVGGKVQQEYSNGEDVMLVMEKNLSLIHQYTFNEDGTSRRNWTQLIATVDRIYYKQ
jgi:hypothetical protein